MTEALAEAAQSNGHAALTTEDQLIVEQMQARCEQLRARRDELQAEIDQLSPDLRRYEKAIAALRGEPLSASGRSKETTPGRKTTGKPSTQAPGTGISEERLVVVEAAIRKVAASQDDFSQVDIRTVTGMGSGTMALAFEALRQRNVIRLVRRDGLKKVFRLTREALHDSEPAA